MRRLFALVTVLAMLLALPLAVNAQEERFEADIHTTGSLVGQDAAGCDLSEGVFTVEVGGAVVETGVTHLRSCPNDDASVVRYTVTYIDDATGNVAVTVGRATLIAADFDNGVLTYSLRERIVSSTTGIVGNAVGSVDVFLTATGFDVVGSNHWKLYVSD